MKMNEATADYDEACYKLSLAVETAGHAFAKAEQVLLANQSAIIAERVGR